MAKRIVIGILLATILFLMLYLGKVTQAAVFTLGGVFAVYEMMLLFRIKDIHPFAAPIYVMAAGFGAWLLLVPLPWTILLFGCIFAIMIEMVLNKRRTVMDCLAGIFIAVYPVMLLIILLHMGVRFGEFGTSALLCAFACPLMGDTFGYFIGSRFGKHKLMPEVSPKKTVEGSIASLFGSVAGGALVYLVQPIWGKAQAAIYAFLIIGLACGFIGQMGDLFASRLKRWAGLKDFSKLFPGHGGMLDRVDSVLFCAPVVAVGFTIYLRVFH